MTQKNLVDKIGQLAKKGKWQIDVWTLLEHFPVLYQDRNNDNNNNDTGRGKYKDYI